MLGFVFAVSLCVCLSVWAVCLGDVRACVRACVSVCLCVCFQLCALSLSVCAVKCLRFSLFFCVFVFVFFFCLEFLWGCCWCIFKWKCVYFPFLLSSRSEEGRIWCLGWWSSLENGVSVSVEKASWVNGCARQKDTKLKAKKEGNKRKATGYLTPDLVFSINRWSFRDVTTNSPI